MLHFKLFMFLILTCSSLLAQTRIEGEYTNHNIGMIGNTLILEEGNFFQSYKGILLGHSTFISKGYYLVQKDTLLLFYDSLSFENPPSSFTVSSKSDTLVNKYREGYKIQEDAANLNITIKGINGEPLPGCNVIFMSPNKSVVIGEIADLNGKVLVSTQGKLIENIVISCLGHKTIWIGMSAFWGYYSEIMVELAQDPRTTYNTKYKIERYLINKQNNGNVRLNLIGNENQNTVLEKVEY